MQLLGLLLEKYVPDATLLRSRTWAGVFQHADALSAMMQQHVLAPLLEGAEDVPETARSTGESWAAGGAGAVNRSWLDWANDPLGTGKGSYVLPAVVVTGLAVLAVGVYIAHKRQR